MSADAVTLGLLGLGLGLAIWALLRMRRLSDTCESLEQALVRARSLGAEQQRRIEALAALEGAQQTTEHLLETGQAVVREVHKGIAAIPFDILEAIPGAGPPTRLLRGVHDRVTDSVYGALSGMNRAVGRELRKGLGGAAQKPIDAEPAAPELPAPDRRNDPA